MTHNCYMYRSSKSEARWGKGHPRVLLQSKYVLCKLLPISPLVYVTFIHPYPSKACWYEGVNPYVSHSLWPSPAPFPRWQSCWIQHGQGVKVLSTTCSCFRHWDSHMNTRIPVIYCFLQGPQKWYDNQQIRVALLSHHSRCMNQELGEKIFLIKKRDSFRHARCKDN